MYKQETTVAYYITAHIYTIIIKIMKNDYISLFVLLFFGCK